MTQQQTVGLWPSGTPWRGAGICGRHPTPVRKQHQQGCDGSGHADCMATVHNFPDPWHQHRIVFNKGMSESSGLKGDTDMKIAEQESVNQLSTTPLNNQSRLTMAAPMRWDKAHYKVANSDLYLPKCLLHIPIISYPPVPPPPPYFQSLPRTTS